VASRHAHEGGLQGGGAARAVVMRLFSQLEPVLQTEGFASVRTVESDLSVDVERYSWHSRTSANMLVSAKCEAEIPVPGKVAQPVASKPTDDCTKSTGFEGEQHQRTSVGVDNEKVKVLTNLGFSRKASDTALCKHSGNVELAANELLTSEEVEATSTADRRSTAQAPLPPQTPDAQNMESKVASLAFLGFSQKACRAALEAAGGNTNSAAESLLAERLWGD